MDAQAKQQVAERVKQATNILVTISKDPSVDQLAACIGLTLLLNKMGKHATAVFSGKVPSTVEFLQPEKTIETNTDSLRDFIISLDKAKADKLRYKVEDQFVRIFITPYKSSLSEKDLEFGQGDYNVEVVIALGVKNQGQLDATIVAHGQILHDATVISINAGDGKAPNLGQINWQDAAASSLSEMLVSISEAFGSNLIDGQMATAFLTGIVAETERFSNAKTSPKVMTMSAQLMAAGANQQLIASKLEPPEPPPLPTPPQPPSPPPSDTKGGSGGSDKPSAVPKEKESSEKSADGSLSVNHGNTPQSSAEVNIDPNEILIDNQGNLERLIELAAQKQAEADAARKKIEEARAAAPPVIKLPDAPLPELPPAETPKPKPDKPTSMPGSHRLLSPLNGDNGPLMGTSFTANTQPDWQAPEEPVDPLAGKDNSREDMVGHAPDVQPPPAVTSNFVPPAAPQSGPPVDNARSAVENALTAPSLPPVDDQTESIAPAAPPPVPPPLPPFTAVQNGDSSG